jgi:hypothetical protein
MRWNRLCIGCCSLIILVGLAGCRKALKIDVDQSLAPVLTAVSGQTLEWVVSARDQSFTVDFDSGLCVQKSPISASYGHPAVCTVAKQDFGSGQQPIFYTYVYEGTLHGKPIRSPIYRVAIGPGGCRYCK